MGFIEMIEKRVEEFGALPKMSIPALDARIHALSGDPMGNAWSFIPVGERADRVAERIVLVAERWNRVPKNIRYELAQAQNKILAVVAGGKKSGLKRGRIG